MASNTVQEYGEAQKEIPTLENGVKVKLMAMESILGSMEIAMRDNSKIVLNMDKVLNILQMEIHIKVTINEESPRAMESITGFRVASSREISKLDSDADKEYGKRL
jgi:hypothetical protein